MLETKVGAKFVSVLAIKNKLYWCIGTGLFMEDIWRPLGTDLKKYIQEMTPLWGIGITHITFGASLQTIPLQLQSSPLILLAPENLNLR